jgi:hypothetical protein
MYQEMVTQLSWWVLGREVMKETVATTKYPKSWWDAVKERFYPKFLKVRFPVKYVTIDTVIKHFHVCPHLEYPDSKGMYVHLTFLQTGGVTQQ